MKRTKRLDQRGNVCSLTGWSGIGLKPATVVTDLELAQVAGGDVYLHNPRGSNNRLGDG